MVAKKEASDSEIDFDASPKKKTKTGRIQSPVNRRWTVQDAMLIKKLREEDTLNWKYNSLTFPANKKPSCRVFSWCKTGYCPNRIQQEVERFMRYLFR